MQWIYALYKVKIIIINYHHILSLRDYYHRLKNKVVDEV